MYDVFGFISTRTFRVLWALEELGQPYSLTQLKPRAPEVLAINPSGKIPALRDGNDVLTDSAAIMTYLADKHAALIPPAGTLPRAHHDALLHTVNDELDGVLWTAARHTFVLPEEHRVPEIKPSLKWEFNRNACRLADRITTPFAAGETFTIADILLTHCLNWARNAGFEHDSQKLSEYAKQMNARPAFQRVTAQAAQG